ncbi:MAG: putative N-acetyltransferase YsnE [Candidatus Heimdallarchaeota archaeon LC_3]|nr:MAG: putative N-acetyltransferase YsnE [Candidatus Heimdallarchaeota archaeon LC_3]
MNKNYRIEKITKKDLKKIFTLLQSLKLPVEGIDDHLSNFFVIKDENEIIGSGGIEIYQEAGLIRSIAVDPKYQKKGLGRKIIEYLLNYANEKGVKELFLLTDTVPKLYEKFGFNYIKRENANSKIEQSEEFKGSCPNTAHLMVKAF